MRIQHNIAALNSYRNLTNNNSAVAKNLEKLSSGYRINRAGDDAAGLAISEKMRAQITGLETAQKNAQDGISLVQTAEGALTEVHSMLNRMVELADQSANGTYDNEVDRTNLQKEIDSLKSEIDRISKATNFNGIKLLDGSIGTAEGISIGTEDAIAGTQIGSAGAITDGVDGRLTPGKAAVAAVDEFYMPDELQVSYNENTSTAGTLSFDLVLGNGKGDNATVNVKLTGSTTAGSVDTFTMEDIVKALNGDSVTGISISITQDSSTVIKDTASLTANYTFKFENNKLISTAKNKGADWGATFGNIVSTGGAAGDGAEDKTAMLDKLHHDLPESGNSSTQIGLGEVTSQGIAGADAEDGRYVVGSIKITLGANTNSALTGTGVKVGDKTYIMQEEGKELDAELQAKIDADNDAFVVVKFTDGDENTALANAINKDTANSNLQAVVIGTDIQISETEAYGNGVYADSLNTILPDADKRKAIDMSEAVGNADVVLGSADESKKITVSDELTEGSQITIGKKTYQFLKNPDDAVDGKIGIQFTDGNAGANAQALLDKVKEEFANAALDADGTSIILGDNKVSADVSSKGLTLQVGDTSDSYQKVSVVVKSTSTASLGIDGIDISTQEGASAAIDKIKDAINSVSSTRGDLGAIQNRLEHTINNLGVTTENITAAESRIRDVDMAKEMMAYTKNNILVQASQAMLAQANQVPQGVLQLLG